MIDGAGNPQIAYRESTNADLKYAKWTGTAWAIQTVDSAGDVGTWASLRLDASGAPRITYRDFTNHSLKYAKWTGTSWVLDTLDRTSDVGQHTSLGLDRAGNPHIGYYDLTSGDLKYATITTTTTWLYPAPGSPRPHAVLSDGVNSYGYDANGNMISGAGRVLTYDAENRPTTVTLNGVPTTFVYDGDGGRVKKTVGGVTTVYIGQLYECTTSCSKYIFAGGQRIALKPVGTSGAIFYYHADHLGSSSVVTDQTGTAVERLAYYPYGQTRTNTGSVDVTHKYTGQRFDDSTGLYFYNARYYDPALGRFIQADTIVPYPGDPQSLNRYSYVRNNPILYTDPSGHFFEWIVGAAIYYGTRSDNPRVQNITGVALQGFGGPIGQVGGTYLLTRNESGRNILAAEIIAATAVATFYCGGCGAVASGALAGEAFGAYGAARSDGDLLTGVVVGGVSGAAGGYAGGLAGGVNTLPGALAAGSVGGFTQGAGYTLAYGGSLQDAWQAGYQGAAQGAAIAGVAWGVASIYNQVVGYDVTWGPGGPAQPKGALAPPIRGANNIGCQGGPCSIFGINLTEGSAVSRFLNQIPGVNSVSGMHDIFQVSSGTGWLRNIVNVPGMPVAAAATYGALLTTAPAAPLTVNQK